MNRSVQSDLAQELVYVARKCWNIATMTTPETWCKNAGVALERTPGIYAGRYLRDPDPKVLLNSSTSKHQARFVVAHELAHHLVAECRISPKMRREISSNAMRKLANIVPCSDTEELLCDQFAGVLLLPAANARRWVRESTGDMASVLDLANVYSITVGACAHQLLTAADFKRPVIVLGPDGRIAETFGGRLPLTQGCRPLHRLNGQVPQDWSTRPTWIRWTPTTSGDVYSTKATGIMDPTGCTTLVIHVIGRHVASNYAR